jgi:hypothetical protein
LLIGAACLVLTLLLISLPALLAGDTVTARWMDGVVLAVAVGLSLSGLVLYIRSVIESRH